MKVRTTILSTWGLALVASLLSGCGGYQLGSVKPALYANLEKIHVPTFENETLEPRLSVIMTNALISQLQQDGTYKVTNEKGADAILRGKIRRTRRYQQRSTQTDILRSRELLEILEIQYHLEDPLTGEKLTAENPYGIDVNDRDAVSGQRTRIGAATGQTTLFLDQNFELSERQALTLAAEDAAEQIVSQLSDGW